MAEAVDARIAIDDVIKSFLAVREGSGISASTLSKHRTFAKQIRGLADLRGYAMLEQFTARDIDAFYANWKLGVRTKGHALGMLRRSSGSASIATGS